MLSLMAFINISLLVVQSNVFLLKNYVAVSIVTILRCNAMCDCEVNSVSYFVPVRNWIILTNVSATFFSTQRNWIVQQKYLFEKFLFFQHTRLCLYSFQFKVFGINSLFSIFCMWLGYGYFRLLTFLCKYSFFMVFSEPKKIYSHGECVDQIIS